MLPGVLQVHERNYGEIITLSQQSKQYYNSKYFHEWRTMTGEEKHARQQKRRCTSPQAAPGEKLNYI